MDFRLAFRLGVAVLFTVPFFSSIFASCSLFVGLYLLCLQHNGQSTFPFVHIEILSHIARNHHRRLQMSPQPVFVEDYEILLHPCRMLRCHVDIFLLGLSSANESGAKRIMFFGYWLQSTRRVAPSLD